MKWVKPPRLDPHRYVTSDCGAYRIHKWPHNGGWLYTAARIVPQPSVVVLGRGSFAECEQACEEASRGREL